MENRYLLTAAKLQRFYGGDPLAWLDGIQAGKVKGFIEAMPIIDAEERLAAMNDLSVASGLVKKGYANKHRRKLQKAASAGDPPGRKKAGKFGKEILESMGIKVG